MPVPLIPCRNTVTGATAEVPETALQHMTDWVPLGDEQPDEIGPNPVFAEGGVIPAEAAAAEDRPAGPPASKSKAAKAAKAATTSKED